MRKICFVGVLALIIGGLTACSWFDPQPESHGKIVVRLDSEPSVGPASVRPMEIPADSEIVHVNASHYSGISVTGSAEIQSESTTIGMQVPTRTNYAVGAVVSYEAFGDRVIALTGGLDTPINVESEKIAQANITLSRWSVGDVVAPVAAESFEVFQVTATVSHRDLLSQFAGDVAELYASWSPPSKNWYGTRIGTGMFINGRAEITAVVPHTATDRTLYTTIVVMAKPGWSTIDGTPRICVPNLFIGEDAIEIYVSPAGGELSIIIE